MKNQKFVLSALVFSGTLTLGLPTVWSQGYQGEGGASGGKEGQASQGREGQTPQARESQASQKETGSSQKEEGRESPMGAKTEKAGGREGKQVAASGEVKQAQQALKEKGHDPGPIDGILGPKTQAALKAFQEANGIKATGRVDAETKGKLGLAGSGREGKMGKVPESKEGREGKDGASD